MTYIEIDLETWFDRYQPVANHIDPNASWDGDMFETYGAEVEYVCAQPIENVWTHMDGDNGTYLSSGYWLVNRIGYFVCKVPYQSDELLSVCVSKDCEECGDALDDVKATWCGGCKP